MDDDLIPIWNVSDILDNDPEIKLQAKTSNGLERYNRHFNNILPTDHPNIVSFALALRDEADRVVQRLEDVDKCRETPPDYKKEPVFPEIPDVFWMKVGVASKGKKKEVARKKA